MNKSLLSKLMAREDLEVIEGNFKTASFDPANRILKLPILKEEYSDAYALFIGHEVGHALYTPDIFSHDSEAFPKIVDIPHSILNIVEDVRIERMVREFYPGLINDFIRGYKRLMDDNFFGIKDVDPNELSFLDRLNLKAKLNNSIDLEFSFAESVMMAKVFEIQTFDDTISVSRELMEFISKEDEESKKEESSQNSEEKNSEVTDSEDEESEEESEEEESEDEESEDEETAISAQRDDDAPLDDYEEEDEALTGDNNLYDSITDQNFRNNESKLTHSDSGITQIKFTKKQLKEEWLYSEKDFEKSLEYVMQDFPEEYTVLRNEYSSEYKEFISDIKPAVNAMVQQFELRKSAMESRKIRESTSGSIDVNKLWKYKLDDRIFKTVLNMPDSKNHGLIMYIDFSASMSIRLHETVKQSVILSMFAKRINIPFELYSFTTNGEKYRSWRGENNRPKYDTHNWAVNLVKIGDSKWSTPKLNKMFERVMFSSVITSSPHKPYDHNDNKWTSYKWAIEPAFRLGGTPLIETSAVSLLMIDDFLKRNRVDKLNVIFLTDGDAQDARVTSSDNTSRFGSGKAKTFIISVEGHPNIEIPYPEHYTYMPTLIKKKIFERIRQKYNLIGFYLTPKKGNVGKNGYSVLRDDEGYDHYVVVHDKRLNAEEEGFSTNAIGETFDKKRLTTIKRDFKKFQKNKKMNKLIAQEFARLVA
jgi:flagellum-specific peptidoglycan hydrolase FlgJ